MKLKQIGQYLVNLDHLIYIRQVNSKRLSIKLNDGINLEFDGTLEEFLLDTDILQDSNILRNNENAEGGSR